MSSAVTGNAPHAAGRVAHARNCGLSLLDGGDVRDQQSPGTNVEQLLELHAVVPRRPDDRSRVLAAVQRQQLIKTSFGPVGECSVSSSTHCDREKATAKTGPGMRQAELCCSNSLL